MRNRIAAAGTLLLLAITVLPIAMAGTAEAQLSLCGAFVSDSSVFAGDSITVEGHGYDDGARVDFMVDSSGFGSSTANSSGVAATTYSFSAAGQYSFQTLGLSAGSACLSAAVIVNVSNPATTTTTSTTTTTTRPPREVDVSCEVIPTAPGGALSDDGTWVVEPGATLEIAGKGFDPNSDAGPILIRSPYAIDDLAAVPAAGDGSFETQIVVPIWPAATYQVVVHQPEADRAFCAGFFTIRIDQPEQTVTECSIIVWEVAAREHTPRFMWGQYVTTGGGFEPGELVAMSLLNSPDVDPDEIISGPFGPVDPDGTFAMPFAPPDTAYQTGETPPVWEARTRTCNAQYVFGATPVDQPAPQVAVPPAFFEFGGFEPSSGECSLIAWRATASNKDIVEEQYQPNAADFNFVNAYGAGYPPNETVSWFLDGQPFEATKGQTVVTDGSGRFRVSGAGALNPIANNPTPYLLTAQTTTCSASATYTGEEQATETTTPGAEPPSTAPTPDLTPESSGSAADGISTEMIALIGLGLGGAATGFFVGQRLRGRPSVRPGPDRKGPGDGSTSAGDAPGDDPAGGPPQDDPKTRRWPDTYGEIGHAGTAEGTGTGNAGFDSFGEPEDPPKS